MPNFCETCGFEAPHHATWCDEEKGIEICKECGGKRGKHSQKCFHKTAFVHRIRAVTNPDKQQFREDGFSISCDWCGRQLIFNSDPRIVDGERTYCVCGKTVVQMFVVDHKAYAVSVPRQRNGEW